MYSATTWGGAYLRPGTDIRQLFFPIIIRTKGQVLIHAVYTVLESFLLNIFHTKPALLVLL